MIVTHEARVKFLLCREVGKAFRLLADDEDCRAIVLSGNGKMFTSGIDLAEFTSSGRQFNSLLYVL